MQKMRPSDIARKNGQPGFKASCRYAGVDFDRYMIVYADRQDCDGQQAPIDPANGASDAVIRPQTSKTD